MSGGTWRYREEERSGMHDFQYLSLNASIHGISEGMKCLLLHAFVDMYLMAIK